MHENTWAKTILAHRLNHRVMNVREMHCHEELLLPKLSAGWNKHLPRIGVSESQNQGDHFVAEFALPKAHPDNQTPTIFFLSTISLHANSPLSFVICLASELLIDRYFHSLPPSASLRFLLLLLLRHNPTTSASFSSSIKPLHQQADDLTLMIEITTILPYFNSHLRRT